MSTYEELVKGINKAVTETSKSIKTGINTFSIIADVMGQVNQYIDETIAVANLDQIQKMVPTYFGAMAPLGKKLSSLPTYEQMAHVTGYISDYYIKAINGLKTGILNKTGGMFETIYEQCTGFGTLLTSYNEIIQNIGINPWLTRAANEYYQNNVPTFDTAVYMLNIGLLDDQRFKTLAHWEGWKDGWLDTLVQAWYDPIPISMILSLYQRGQMTAEDARRELKRFKYSDRMAGMALSLSSTMPEPYRAAEACGRGLLSIGETEKAFIWAGLTKEQAKIWTDAQQTRPSVGMLFDMKYRGILDEQQVHDILRLSGYTDADANSLIRTLPQIPPPADLITMVVREAWEDWNYVPAPPKFTQYMGMKGFSSDWCDRYWIAHFNPMALTQAYSNLQRGYWTEEQFDQYLTIADIHPRWHKDILAVAYQAPTVRELGYGFDVGVYNRDDIIKYRRYGGLSLEDATKASDALIDYRVDAERNAIRTQYLNLFINNAIDQATFMAHLTRLRTNVVAQVLWVERGMLGKQLKEISTPMTESKSATRADVQYMYESGLRDQTWFNDRLKAMGYSTDNIQMYLDESNYRISQTKGVTAATKIKQPTLSEYHTFYMNGLMDRATLTAKLRELGYEADDTELLIQSFERVTPAPTKELTTTTLTTLYKAGMIDRVIFLQKLTTLGYTTDDAELIIKQAEIENPKTPLTRQLTESELEDLYFFGYFTTQQLVEKYKERGFTQQDAELKTYLKACSIYIPLWKAQYSKAWLSAAELYQNIIAVITPLNTIGNTEAIADQMMMGIVKNTGAERIAPEKDLTKAEILKGAKNQILTYQQAKELLMNLGYDEGEADYLLVLNGVMAAGDPTGYWDARRMIEMRKKALKQPYYEIPQELIEMETRLKEAQTKSAALKDKPEAIAEWSKYIGHAQQIEGQIKIVQSRLVLKTK